MNSIGNAFERRGASAALHGRRMSSFHLQFTLVPVVLADSSSYVKNPIVMIYKYIYIYIFIFLQKLFSVGGFTVNDSRDPDRNGSTLVPVVAADLLSPMSILFATPDLAFEQ